jgi:ABC-type transport system substrate-binding protein
MLAAGGALFGAALAEPAATGPEIRRGGTFRISMYTGVAGFGSVDPALVDSFASDLVVQSTCARLMNFRDARLPEGFRVVPEVAARMPRVSGNGRVYTFTLRGGQRFSNGAPVPPAAFTRAIERARALGDVAFVDFPLAQEIAATRARGRTLAITLRRPMPNFPARLALAFCAIPRGLPADPEGAAAPIHSPAPYYIAELVRGRRVVLLRNRFYRGIRPQRVDRFLIDLGRPREEVIRDIERGRADWGWVPAADVFERGRELQRRYGLNRARFWVSPGLFLRGFVFNTRRPLFRNNARLRRAINFAVDRPALLRERGYLAGRLTDQYLPPGMPGFRDAKIYPLRRPDLRRARALARGHLRGGKAVLYVCHLELCAAQGQILRRNLRGIGLDVDVRSFANLFGRMAQRGEPWDIGWLGFNAPPDPYDMLEMFDGRNLDDPFTNFGHFSLPRFNRLFRQAERLQGSARYRAYGRLDVLLAREAAPFVAYSFDNTPTLVSARVDRRCIVLRPELDLAAVCLKR